MTRPDDAPHDGDAHDTDPTQQPPAARAPRLSPTGSRLSEKVILTNQRLLEIQREEEEALLELLRSPATRC